MQRPRDGAMRLDATPATHPIVQPAETLDQVNQTGDAITYEKGQSVIRMIERYVGAEPFREGVRNYIRPLRLRQRPAHRPVGRARGRRPRSRSPSIARDFTEKAGVPLVRVDPLTGERGAQVILRQGRFGVDQASKQQQFWRLPVLARSLAGGPVIDTILTPGPVVQSISSPAGGPMLVNYGQSGYFRTLYAQSIFEALAQCSRPSARSTSWA